MAFLEVISGNKKFQKVAKDNCFDGCLNWAIDTAFEKTNNTIDSWRKRSDSQRFLNILTGDLAKNIVKNYLEENDNTLQIDEYDRIREDFLKSDDYDLKCNDFELEIKSSVEKQFKNSEVAQIAGCRNIIINKGNCHESAADIIIQCYFLENHLGQIKKYDDGVSEFDLSDKLNLTNEVTELFKNIELYICAWINKSDINVNDFRQEPGRNYVNFKITDSNNIEELIEKLNENLNK